jgi:hypothetical protein
MQLHPHFLFNSLNAITVLVRDQRTRDATRMLDLLSDLLRQVLRTDPAHDVPLAQEIRFLEQYLAIEQVRFSDRLTVSFAVDADVRDAAREVSSCSGCATTGLDCGPPAPRAARAWASPTRASDWPRYMVRGLDSTSPRVPTAGQRRRCDFHIDAMGEIRALIADDEPLARRGSDSSSRGILT